MSLSIESASIADVKIIVPVKHGDARGFFSETWNRAAFASNGMGDLDFVQDNHSKSASVGTVRGLHFQSPPHAQAKLVRVVQGAVLDVAVDLRRASPTFGQHAAVHLSAENWSQLLVPEGFAHGFITLEPDTEVIYKVTDYYAPESDRGILWNDPDLSIAWPIPKGGVVLSERDKSHPRLRDLGELF